MGSGGLVKRQVLVTGQTSSPGLCLMTGSLSHKTKTKERHSDPSLKVKMDGPSFAGSQSALLDETQIMRTCTMRLDLPSPTYYTMCI